MMPFQKGVSLSDAHYQKLSELFRGENNPFFGRKHTEETRQKIREMHIGKPLPEATKLKMSVMRKGKPSPKKGIPAPLSEEGRRRLREATSGKNNSQFGKYGEKSSNWQGGKSFEPYCVKFNREFKNRVRVFFGYQCVECGTSQNGEKLSVHHVNFDKQTCCNDAIPLFVSLCHSCHSKTQFNRPFWEYWFTETINRLYGGKCYLPEGVSCKV